MGQTHPSVADVIAGVDTTTTTPVPKSAIVVGNGPISDAQYATINERIRQDANARVITFNHAPHNHHLDRVDIVAVRGNGTRFSGARQRLSNGGTFLPVVQASPFNTLWPLSNIMMRPRTRDVLKTPDILFPSSTTCGERCDVRFSSAKYGPSSGAVILSHLDESSSIRDIDVYGMNFTFKGGEHYHMDFQDPSVVPDTCRKCTFYKPPASSCYHYDYNYNKDTNAQKSGDYCPHD